MSPKQTKALAEVHVLSARRPIQKRARKRSLTENSGAKHPTGVYPETRENAPGPVIKKKLDTADSDARTPSSIRAAGKAAEKLLVGAQKLREELLEDSNKQCAQIERGAYEAAYSDAKAAALVELLNYDSAYSTAVAKQQQQLLSLCHSLCLEVLGLDTPALLQSLEQRIRKALAEQPSNSRPGIRLHPEDRETLSRANRLTGLEPKSDPSIQRGNFVLETAVGQIESNLEKHLTALVSALSASPAIVSAAQANNLGPEQCLITSR